MREIIGWVFCGMGMLCAIGALIHYASTFSSNDSDLYDPRPAWQLESERQAKLAKNPKFIRFVFLGLLFGVLGMYLIGMFGEPKILIDLIVVIVIVFVISAIVRRGRSKPSIGGASGPPSGSSLVKTGEQFTLPQSIGLVASPDSTRLAYVTEDWNGFHVEVNGQRFRTYDRVLKPTFSPDSQHIAYAAEFKGKRFIVCDEVEYGPYDDIGETSPFMSPDSKHITYTAQRGRDWFAFLDGDVKGGPYEGFSPGGIAFSPDSQHIAYVVKKGDSWMAVIDGEEKGVHPTIVTKSWSFSPDSKKLAYIACVEGKRVNSGWLGKACVIVGGKIGQSWDYDSVTKKRGLASEIYFSQDSQRVAYRVTQDEKSFCVIDDGSQKKYDSIVSGWERQPEWERFPDHGKVSCRSNFIVFSPDSCHFAYAARDRNDFFLIYDGEEKCRHHSIFSRPIVFSPDSKRVAYEAGEGPKQFLVVDWKAMGSHYGLPPVEPSFSADSEHVAYIASNESNDYLLVVDSRSWPIQGGPIVGAKLVWDGPENLHTLIANGREVKIARFKIG